jgi:quinol-cytochrome oxidoreductase complex cytochrome b subunit
MVADMRTEGTDMPVEPAAETRDGLLTRIRHSIFRGPFNPGTDGERRRAVLNNLVLHIHPSMVPARTIRFTHTWGLGGMCLVLITLLGLTGILMTLVYEPFPGLAHGSVSFLRTEVRFGQFVRNVHHWSANFLVVVVILHALRVFFTGAFHPPRQFNWVLGLLLFFCVLASNFTGYLLPWDQLSYWAITIVTGMFGYIPVVGAWLKALLLGGTEIGAGTLLIFYSFHTSLLPLLILTLMAFHFWRVRKARGVVLPRTPGEETAGNPEKVTTIPHLVLKEGVTALALIAVIFTIAALFNAPLGELANPGMSPNPAKAPWYFLGIQELLLHFHPLFAVLVIPTIIAGGLLILPYLRYDSLEGGVWFHSTKGRKMALTAAVSALVVMPIGIFYNEFLVDFAALAPGWFPVISTGLIPAGLVTAVVAGLYIYMKRRFKASNNEAVQALFVFLLVSYLVLTAAGVWFRGPGMAMVWPWGGPSP